MSRMKAVVFAALFYAVAFAALIGIPGAQAEATRCDDAPGMEGCTGENTSSSSSAKKDTDAVPWTMELHKTIAFEEGTVSNVCIGVSYPAVLHAFMQSFVAP